MRNSVLTVLFLVLVVLPTMALAAGTIRDIEVTGNQRIAESTILSYLDARPGQPMSAETLDRGLKSLFGTGLFADVILRQKGQTLVVEIVENPIINRIAFEGNDEIKDNELLAEIQMRPRQVFTRTKVQNDLSKIERAYSRKGLFAAQVRPSIIKLDQNRVDLVFEIDEGKVTEVRSIRFVGNKKFSDDALREAIATKQARWYRFLSSADRYDPDRLDFDQELLRRFYAKNGYADMRVTAAAAELSPDESDFFITFSIDEGKRYRLGKVDIDSKIRNLDVTPLQEEIDVEPGEWYDAEDVTNIGQAMKDRLGDLQYAFAAVRPSLNRNRDEGVLDVTFQINETPRVFVNRIDIKGNIRTEDRVIRREIDLAEGDPFNRSKLAESESDIRDLDYFEKVEVKTKPSAAPDKVDLEVAVSEKSTGELSIGAGFSTNDGPLADFRIRERNFLGKGQDLTLGAIIAGERTEYNFSFTEPYFMGRDVSAGIDLFNITRDFQDESSFDQERLGGAFRLGYPLSDNWRQSLRYRLEDNEITDVSSTASRFIRDQEGTRSTSAVSQRLTYEDLDSVLFPTEGLTSWIDSEVAGLGGDAKYYSGAIGSAYYYPISEGWIFNVLGEVGAIRGYGDTTVQINERFYLGGSTLRGFEQGGVGPRDLSTDDSLGGNNFYRGTVELTFPLPYLTDLGFKGHGFSDFGSLWGLEDATDNTVADENSLRASAGVGVSWRSPLGPLRLDFATPYLDEDYDEKEVFRINFGTRF